MLESKDNRGKAGATNGTAGTCQGPVAWRAVLPAGETPLVVRAFNGSLVPWTRLFRCCTKTVYQYMSR